MNTTRGLVRTVARNSAIKLAVIFGGFVLGYVTGEQLGPATTVAFESPAQAPAISAPLTDPEEFSPQERAAWLTRDCKTPTAWPKADLPGSVIVRDEATNRMSRVDFAAAFTGAEAGTLWTLALCDREKPVALAAR